MLGLPSRPDCRLANALKAWPAASLPACLIGAAKVPHTSRPSAGSSSRSYCKYSTTGESKTAITQAGSQPAS